MDVRRMMTALAVPCALLSAGIATGQNRGAYGPHDPVRVRTVASPNPSPNDEWRAPVLPEPQRASITSIESWAIGDDAELSLGRFRVVDRARPRTHMERERNLINLEAETKGIAGAGVRVRF